MATPSPRFARWLPTTIVVVLLGLVSFLVVTGAEVPGWLAAATVSALGAALGIDTGLIRGRDHGKD